MKNVLLGLLVGMLGFGLWFYLQQPDSQGGGLESDGQGGEQWGAQGERSALESGLLAKGGRTALQEEQEGEFQVALDSLDAAGDTSDLCKITGVVLNEKDQPVAGAQLMLAGSAPWVGAAVVEFPTEDASEVGWLGETDDAGRFEWSVPVPPRGMASLWVRAGEMHSGLMIHFGGSYRISREPLQVGAVALGVLRLSPAGVLEGYVFDTDGKPIESAMISKDSGWEWQVLAPARSNAQGYYRLGSLPSGVFGLKATHPKHITEVRHLIEVETERAGSVEHFVMTKAPTLSGRIVDTSERPIEGVQLTAWSDGYGEEAFAETDSEGAFLISLARIESYALDITKHGYRLDPSQESYGGFYEPGAKGIVFQMVQDPIVAVHVTDALSGVPIEEFGVNVGYGVGKQGGKKLSSMGLGVYGVGHYPRGIAEVGARVGLDLVSVRAPGYSGAYENEVIFDPGTENVMSIALQRGATYVGKVTSGGMPVAGAFVSIAPIELIYGSDAPDIAEPKVTNLKVDGYGTLRAKTDAEGHFLFGGVNRGSSYRLSANSASQGCATLFPLQHTGNGVQDLGAIELGSGETVTGEVLLPPGVAPHGLTIRLNGNDLQHLYCDPQGKFEVHGLCEGMYKIQLEETLGRLAAGAPQVVHVVQGNPQHIVLDARRLGLCTVAVHVQAGGLDCSSSGFSFEPTDPADQFDPDVSLDLGGLDAVGFCAGVVRACGEAKPAIHIIGLGHFKLPDLVQLESGGALDLTLTLPIAKLQLELPQSTQLPIQARLYVRIGNFFQRYTLKNGQWTFESPWAGVVDGRTFTLSIPETGEMEFSYRLTDPNAQAIREVSGKGFAMRTPRIVEGTQTLKMVEGETTTVVLN